MPVHVGRTTPREHRLSGKHAPSQRLFRQSLRTGEDAKVRSRRSQSAGPRSQRDQMYEGGDYSREADRVAETDGDWRCGSFRYCNSHFHNSLRSWDGNVDVATRTPKDWRVPASDTLGLGGSAFGHDLTLNDLEGWRRSSPLWVDKQFTGAMRDYEGQDVAVDEHGADRRPQSRHKGDVSSGQGASIWRDAKLANVMSTARADEHFLGSLRCDRITDSGDYQQRRRRNLNLPAYKTLTAEQTSKAKRLFAQMDVNRSGTIDGEELRKLLKALGHKVEGGPKAIKDLIKLADEGATDSKLKVQDT